MRGLGALLRRVLKHAGLENIRVHALRRTVGSWLAQSGRSLHLIGDVLNHRDPKPRRAMLVSEQMMLNCTGSSAFYSARALVSRNQFLPTSAQSCDACLPTSRVMVCRCCVCSIVTGWSMKSRAMPVRRSWRSCGTWIVEWLPSVAAWALARLAMSTCARTGATSSQRQCPTSASCLQRSKPLDAFADGRIHRCEISHIRCLSGGIGSIARKLFDCGMYTLGRATGHKYPRAMPAERTSDVQVDTACSA